MRKTSTLFRIPCYMFGRDAKLRPAAFMDIAQELAAFESEQIHVSDAEIAPHNIVWILARMSVDYIRLPRKGETVTVQTWSRGACGPFFIREYRMLDSTGEAIINSTSSWVIMNTMTRRIERVDSIAGIINPGLQCTEAAMEPACSKIILPKDAVWTDAGCRKVMTSDTDYNGHANNARYAVWAYDALCEVTGDSCGSECDSRSSSSALPDIKTLEINFNKEAHPGETVSLLHSSSGHVHLIEGRVGSIQSFICRLTLREPLA